MTTEQAAPRDQPWAVAQQQFDLAAEHLKLDPGLRTVLREPRRALTVHFPVKMDDGTVRSSPATASSTTWAAARPRAVSATTRTSRSTRSRPSRCG